MKGSTPTASSKRFELVAKAYDYPIRDMPKQDVVEKVNAALIICASMYCGVQKDKTEPETMKEATRFVYSKFNMLGLDEIREAFSMCAANIFEGVNMKAYFGTFTISMLGDILHAYKKHRDDILDKLLKAQQAAEDERLQEERKVVKNEEVRLQAKEEIELAIKAAKDGLPFWEHWEDIPIHYTQIAIDYKIINLSDAEKLTLWHEAQRLSKMQIIKEATEVLNTEKRAMQVKAARDILQQIKEGQEINKLKDNAKRIYSKLLIWEYVKPIEQ